MSTITIFVLYFVWQIISVYPNTQEYSLEVLDIPFESVMMNICVPEACSVSSDCLPGQDNSVNEPPRAVIMGTSEQWPEQLSKYRTGQDETTLIAVRARGGSVITPLTLRLTGVIRETHLILLCLRSLRPQRSFMVLCVCLYDFLCPPYAPFLCGTVIGKLMAGPWVHTKEGETRQNRIHPYTHGRKDY